MGVGGRGWFLGHLRRPILASDENGHPRDGVSSLVIVIAQKSEENMILGSDPGSGMSSSINGDHGFAFKVT